MITDILDLSGDDVGKYPPVACPRCFRPLACSGTIAVHGAEPTPVYQCDDCVTPFVLDGVTFDAAYTFTLDAAGRPRDHELGCDPSFN